MTSQEELNESCLGLHVEHPKGISPDAPILQNCTNLPKNLCGVASGRIICPSLRFYVATRETGPHL